MFAAAIIIFRETFEIALLLGVIMAATRGLKGRTKTVISGIFAGAVGAGVVAFFAGEISSMAEGVGQEIFNAAVLFAASAMIGWTVIWMSKHAREFSRHIKKLGSDIVSGDAPLYSMAVVIALAMLREGSEIVLFLYGMMASNQPISSIAMGCIIGISGGTMAGLLLYLGLIKVSPKHIFAVTTWMLVLIAAGMASIASGYLVAAGYFSDLTKVVWDSSHILSESSIIGNTIHVLLGYSERPMQVQLVFYVLTVIMLTTGVVKLKQEKKQ